MPGANLSYENQQRIWTKILNRLGIPGVWALCARTSSAPGDAVGTFPRQPAICEKAGAPATNTADDAPTGVGDLCYDSTNDTVYRCSAYTNGTTFTWGEFAAGNSSNVAAKTVGGSLRTGSYQRILTKIFRKMGFTIIAKNTRRPSAGGATVRVATVFEVAGVPTSDNADYAPLREGDLCWDSTNNDVYQARNVDNETSHSWTKIVD